jgi:hypothetical protein
MKDVVVIQSLRNRGVGLSNVQEVLAYEAIERKPRYLDKAPRRLNLTKASDITVFGCYSDFIMHYIEIKKISYLEQAVIDLKGVKRFCDPDVYRVLYVLMREGVCNNLERAQACFDVFKTIITTPGDTLTVGKVYSALAEYQPMNYYAGELVKSIHVCLFNEKAPVLYWFCLCEFSGFYGVAMELGKDIIRENCESEKDVEKFLRPVYKQAKDDKEFMENVYAPGANKWLIPILYLLKDSHPEALNPNTKGGGFA